MGRRRPRLAGAPSQRGAARARKMLCRQTPSLPPGTPLHFSNPQHTRINMNGKQDDAASVVCCSGSAVCQPGASLTCRVQGMDIPGSYDAESGAVRCRVPTVRARTIFPAHCAAMALTAGAPTPSAQAHVVPNLTYEVVDASGAVICRCERAPAGSRSPIHAGTTADCWTPASHTATPRSDRRGIKDCNDGCKGGKVGRDLGLPACVRRPAPAAPRKPTHFCAPGGWKPAADPLLPPVVCAVRGRCLRGHGSREEGRW